MIMFIQCQKKSDRLDEYVNQTQKNIIHIIKLSPNLVSLMI